MCGSRKLEAVTSVEVGHALLTEDYTESEESESCTIQPMTLVLAQTLEKVNMPADLVGLIQGRSSLARCGLAVHLTAPKIDPGFNAVIALEIVNFGPMALELRAGATVAQIMFQKLSRPVPKESLYGTGPHDTFQHQQTPLPLAGAGRR